METSPQERQEILSLYRKLRRLTAGSVTDAQTAALRNYWKEALESGRIHRTSRIHPLLGTLENAWLVASEIGMRRSSVISSVLYHAELLEGLSLEQIEKDFGPSTAGIMNGLIRVSQLNRRQLTSESENFRNLLLSFAQDGRVILILIAENVAMLRRLDSYDEETREMIVRQADWIFAPLAHRMGLYAMKTELEDLSLKYHQPSIYEEITRKLAESKSVREAYIRAFIGPVRQKLEAALSSPFEIKGRTKSVHSIWNKIRNKQLLFEDIYDIFAIRVIIDSPVEREKADCWQAFSVVTDMYQPNPSRTRDWLSIPKSNGYESLHTTVLGPEDKWVEVQIRTTRMNEVAEKGLAAHWRYKGIKAESGLDEMMTRIREILESQDDPTMAEDFRMSLYEDEIYVFSPKGELYKLPVGATVLDFAYSIHSNLGNHCVGAKVNERNVPIRYALKSGDAVEILTSANQVPKQDWLNYVHTTKARNRIKQTIKENRQKQAEFGRDSLLRRMKNRKIEFDESLLSKLMKRFRFRVVTDFFAELGENHLDVNQVIDAYLDIVESEKPQANVTDAAHSAEAFAYETVDDGKLARGEDVLIIDQNLSGIDFKLAKCCNPIYGDEVFGFVSVSGGIKIHKSDCPNAAQMRERYPYRMVRARWAGQAAGSLYPATLQIIGKDDIGIVTNITSLITKDCHAPIRSIRIDSTDGLFRGFLTVMVSDRRQLDSIIKKVQGVKGVKQVIRE